MPATSLQSGLLGRRAAFFLPMALPLSLSLGLIACGQSQSPRDFSPPRYGALPPIQLNVATIDVVARFAPLGVPPDVSAASPLRPIEELRRLGQERLTAIGNEGRAVFAIQDAALLRQGDVITGRMAVVLEILSASNERVGFAEARVSHRFTGRVEDLRATLNDMTKAMLDEMNTEVEYQVRRHLRDWLTPPNASTGPVEQTPLGRAR